MTDITIKEVEQIDELTEAFENTNTIYTYINKVNVVYKIALVPRNKTLNKWRITIGIPISFNKPELRETPPSEYTKYFEDLQRALSWVDNINDARLTISSYSLSEVKTGEDDIYRAYYQTTIQEKR